jgi:peptidoglycan/xylan/chitin deacetylase (PgdA/CDA1 family)
VGSRRVEPAGSGYESWRVVIINVCFHGIGTPTLDREPDESRYWVTKTRFYEILDEIATWPPARISFDDGNYSDLKVGLPALVERGLGADFFVLAGRLGQPDSLDPQDVRELHASGMGIGSHGMRHRSWRRMDPRERHEELVTARDRLASITGAPVVGAACPVGAYDRALLRDLRRLGYPRVFTSDRRPAREAAWLQPRYSIRRDDTPETLRASVLARASVVARLRSSAAGLVKRWR